MEIIIEIYWKIYSHRMAPFFSWRVRRSRGVKTGGKDITDSCSDWMDGWRWKYGVSSRAFFLFSISQLLNFFIVWSVCAFCQCHSGIWQEAQLYPFFVFFLSFFFLSVIILLYLLNLESHLASYIPGKKTLIESLLTCLFNQWFLPALSPPLLFLFFPGSF